MCNIKIVALALVAGLSVLNHSHILTQESEQNLTYTAQARKLDKDIQLTTLLAQHLLHQKTGMLPHIKT